MSEQTASAAPSGRTDPGEGDRTGGGATEAQNGSQAALDAAIEAATIAVHDAHCSPDCRESPTTMGMFTSVAEAAVRAAEPILRQAVAEQIARTIEERRAALVQTDEWDDGTDSLLAAAEIAREVGRA